MYILDTSFLSICRDYYYPDNFPTLWEELNKLIQAEKISSVADVKRELLNYGGEQEYLKAWIENNKHIFTEPTIEDQENLKRIFSKQSHQSLIDKRKILRGGIVADPFIIAKAISLNATVVSRETPAKSKSSPVKIPDVCSYFNIKHMTPQEFIETMGWRF